MVRHPRLWVWSSYRATVGETPAPPWVTIDWILHQFGQRVGPAQDHYRAFVAEGRGGACPWDQLQGQMYLGSEAFIARHQPNRRIRDVPRRQTQAIRPTLRTLFQRKGAPHSHIAQAYRQYGYRLREIADHLGVHEATVSRRLKRAEQQQAS
jgi:putative transposase